MRFLLPSFVLKSFLFLLRYSFLTILFYSLESFHISISWWSSTGVWVTASPLKYPGLFSVYNPVVRMVSTFPLISKSFSAFTKPLRIVSSVLITIGITVTFVFQSFFYSLARSRYLSLFSLSFNFTMWSVKTAKSTIQQVLFLWWLSLGLIVWPRLNDPFVS